MIELVEGTIHRSGGSESECHAGQGGAELARELPELAQAIAFRNILIHGYAAIDDRTVWRTVQESLSALRARLTALLDRMNDA